MEAKNKELMLHAAPGAQYRNLQLAEIKELAGAMVSAKMFPDIESANTAYVKILAGQEMGVSPFQAMSGIHIIKGRATLASNLMATKVMESGRYRYRVMALTDEIAHLDFQAMENGKWVKIGESRFTSEDAQRAGTQNMGRFPRNMLFARALSNGVKWYCPDVFGGAPVYVEGEIIDGHLVDEMTDAEIKEHDEATLAEDAARLNRRKKAAAAGQKGLKNQPEPEPEPEPKTEDEPPIEVLAETADVIPTDEEVESLDMDAAMDQVATTMDLAEETENVEAITPAQRRKLYALMSDKGVKTEADKKALFQALTGYESSNDLSKTEAAGVIDDLENMTEDAVQSLLEDSNGAS